MKWGNYERTVRRVPVENKTETGSAQDYTDKKHGSYRALLFRKEWKEKRLQILNRDDNKCQFCGRNKNLHVHHRQYHFRKSSGEHVSPWEYADHLLITICKKCHDKGHRIYKVPTFQID